MMLNDPNGDSGTLHARPKAAGCGGGRRQAARGQHRTGFVTFRCDPHARRTNRS
ncbi:hypothetical protein [Burkholderia sp. PU8-34]